ncbi:hypothetical protein [Proteiniborus sp.]|uniref:hypothetical protein n=1 Tax=Proteiniborus sp. TaxID=2079015 RepID=UPI00333148E4
MNKFDILGFPVEEGLELLQGLSDKKIEIIETKASKIDKGTILSEPRILRCTETESSFTVVISYF